MIRKLVGAAVLVAALLGTAVPARATCTPGFIGIRNGKPVVELPRCNPPPP